MKTLFKSGVTLLGVEVSFQIIKEVKEDSVSVFSSLDPDKETPPDKF